MARWTVLPSRWDSLPIGGNPTHESVGYFRMSLRDNGKRGKTASESGCGPEMVGLIGWQWLKGFPSGIFVEISHFSFR